MVVMTEKDAVKQMIKYSGEIITSLKEKIKYMIAKIVNFAHEYINPNGKENHETGKGTHA